MRLALPVKLLLVLSFLLAVFGCQAIRRYETARIYNKKSPSIGVVYTSNPPISLTIDDKYFADIPFEARCKCSNVTVIYQSGMRPVAISLARHFSSLLSDVEKGIGLRIPFKVQVALVYAYSSFQGLESHLEEPDTLTFVLMLPVSDATIEGLIQANPNYTLVLVHELVEGSLMCRAPSESPVTPDFPVHFPYIPFPIHNHTRWFREGLANYAGRLALRKVHEQMVPHEYSMDPILRYRFNSSVGHDRPFTSLAAIREDIFDWVNSPEGKYSGEYDQKCYNASLGIFLYLEHRFGEGSVKRIVQNLKGNGCLDREKLIEIINNTLRTDLRVLIRNFKFPEDGLKLTKINPVDCPGLPPSEWRGVLVNEVKPDSPAAAWGVQKGDIINSMQGQPVRNTLDFEIAKLDLVEKGQGTVRVVRKGETHELRTWLK